MNHVRLAIVLLLGSGCSTTPDSACSYSEQRDKSNDLNTANDVPPAGPEPTPLVLGSSLEICGAVDQGNYTTHDDHTADGDSYQFTVAAQTTGTLSLNVTDGLPPAPQFRVFVLGADPSGQLDMAVTGNAVVGAPVGFDLQPGTYILDMQAKQATGPLSRSYPYEITFDVVP